MNGSSNHDITSQLLSTLSTLPSSTTSLELSNLLHLDHQKIIGALKSIEATDPQILSTSWHTSSQLKLTTDGLQTLTDGSLEARVFHALKTTPNQTRDQIKNLFPNSSIGLNNAVSLGWVTAFKTGDETLFQVAVDEITDSVKLLLQQVADGDHESSSVPDLLKKKLVVKNKVSYCSVTRGPSFRSRAVKQQSDLTCSMLADESWKDVELKSFNFDCLGVPPPLGCLHPLMKVRSAIRQIFFEMGFQEMETDNYVESSFWNFDALFQPQKHPARDMHDTFFMADPQTANIPQQEYLQHVKDMHTIGGSGSIGYNSDWHPREAEKNILRTHTTAVTARMLYKLAQKKEFKPAKYFSIDRVFRNETLDATHLAEFHQIEGSVIDYNISLSDLMGLVTIFFNKLGITDLRFKAAYNPYTEPSMEIFHYHKQLGKLVEIGNSGVIRREVLAPMGFPEDVSCIAWGISLERPTMILYEMTNIRDLVGHRVGLSNIKSTPICRFNDVSAD